MTPRKPIDNRRFFRVVIDYKDEYYKPCILAEVLRADSRVDAVKRVRDFLHSKHMRVDIDWIEVSEITRHTSVTVDSGDVMVPELTS